MPTDMTGETNRTLETATTGGAGAVLPLNTSTQPLNTAQLGLWAFLGTLTMLFAGFTSAYLVRRAGSDWQVISFPGILWLNTLLLAASSFTLELARASLKRGRKGLLRRWLSTTILLGLGFLLGQFFVWRELVTQGVYLSSSPHSSFFYMLTAVHAVHLAGGLAALFYARVCARAYAFNGASGGQTVFFETGRFGICAGYWHFVGGVWVYLFLLMFV